MSRVALGLEGVLDGGGQGGDGEPAVVGPDDLAGRGDQGQPGLVLHAVAVRHAAGGVDDLAWFQRLGPEFGDDIGIIAGGDEADVLAVRLARDLQLQAARDVAGVKFYARAVSDVDMKDLKSLADEAKQSVGSGVVAIAAASEDGKASIVVAVTPDLTSRFNAVDLVRLGSAALGGKGGGGRPDMAQAGGPDGAKTHEALAAVEEGVRRAAGA